MTKFRFMWAKQKQLLWEWRGVLVAAPSMAALVIGLHFSGLLQLLEWAAYDQFFCWRPREGTDERIVIVGIDESDLQKVKRGIVPDQTLAQLIEKLKQQQPRAIGLDIYRDLPEEPGHQELVKVYKSTPNLIGIKKVVGDASGSAVNPPPELEQRGQIGANDLQKDADLKLRRGFLYITKDGKTVESFGLKLALMYLEKEGIKQLGVPDNPNQFKLGKTVFAPLESNDGGYVNVDAKGYQILFNFRGYTGSFKTVTMSQVLENKIPADLVRDRIVLIGYTAPSKNDFFSTPYSSAVSGLSKPTAGVEIHANLTSQILSAAMEGRNSIQTWSEPLEWLWIFVASTIGATLSWQARYVGGIAKFSPGIAAEMLLAAGGIIGSSYLAFLGGWWIPVVPPLLALSGSAIAVTAYLAHTAGAIRKTFGRYLNDEVVARLLEYPEGLKLGGERRKLTILMSDLRGFSAVSERLPPETVVKMLNIYLGIMADVISSYQGTIDEFIGDAILVLFGAPTQREDDTQRAVACAIAMQLAMETVNQENAKLGLPKIEMGIGLNTGEVVVGNIGSEKRAKYGVVGSHVNLTGRIESYTVGGQILISESTLNDAGCSLKINREMQVQPKGFNEPITLYEVGGISGDHNLFLAEEEENLIALEEEILLQYTVLDGKHVDAAAIFQGSLVRLSATGGEIRSEHPEKPLSNLKICLLNEFDGIEYKGDIYAKVLEKPAEGVNCFSIYFTAVPPDIDSLFEKLHQNGKK